MQRDGRLRFWLKTRVRQGVYETLCAQDGASRCILLPTFALLFEPAHQRRFGYGFYPTSPATATQAGSWCSVLLRPKLPVLRGSPQDDGADSER